MFCWMFRVSFSGECVLIELVRPPTNIGFFLQYKEKDRDEPALHELRQKQQPRRRSRTKKRTTTNNLLKIFTKTMRKWVVLVFLFVQIHQLLLKRVVGMRFFFNKNELCMLCMINVSKLRNVPQCGNLGGRQKKDYTKNKQAVSSRKTSKSMHDCYWVILLSGLVLVSTLQL